MVKFQYNAMKDQSIMPFGKYKGKKMGEVPASYLLWIYDEGIKDGDVKTYIVDNLDALKLEVKK